MNLSDSLMNYSNPILPPFLVLDRPLKDWLLEDIGRGDRTTQSLLLAGTQQNHAIGVAKWVAKEDGVVAGLPIAARVFYLLDQFVTFKALALEGRACQATGE